MRMQALDRDIALTADADFDFAFDDVALKSPFYAGATAILVICATSDIADVTITAQRRTDQQDETSAFITLVDVDGNNVIVDQTDTFPQFFEIELPQNLRLNVNEGVTGVGEAGAYLLQN